MSTENINNSTIDTEEISLKELIFSIKEWWKYLLSKWLVILICGLVGGGLGYLYAYTKKPIYTATTTFVLEDEKSGGGLSNLAGLASMAGIDLGSSGGGIFQGDNILQLYKSRAMIEKTLLTKVSFDGKNQLLINRYIDFNELRKLWAKKPELKNIQFENLKGIDHNESTRLQDSVMGEVVKDINLESLSASKPDKKLSIINVSVKAKDEVFAKLFNDAIVKNVNDFYVSTKTKKSQDNVNILQHKTDSVRQAMNGAIYTAVAVSDATPNLNPTRQIQRVAPAQKAQFSAETNKSILAEMVKNLEITKMSLLRETPLIQVIDKPIYPLKIDKMGKAKGIALGGFLFGFFAVGYFTLKKILLNI